MDRTVTPVEPTVQPTPTGDGRGGVPAGGLGPSDPVRYTPPHAHLAVARTTVDPGRIVRWLYAIRVATASAILLAAIFVWRDAEPDDTLVATLAFALGSLATVVSALWTEVWRRPAGRLFHLAQFAVDLTLVTAAVHVTGGAGSQFAALYVLVFAGAALVLPIPDALGVAALGCLAYVFDAFVLRGGPAAASMLAPGGGTGGVWVQLVVLAVVSGGAALIGQRLRTAGPGGTALAAALVKVQLEAADILRTIRSGIITVDRAGRLLYANPAADELLGLKLRTRIGRPILAELAGISPELASALERSAHDGVRRTRLQGTVHRDGLAVPIGVTTTVTDARGGPADEGDVATATAIFQDISDTRRAQALAVRNERLQAVAELSASLAHEIKNPLASIRSAAEQLDGRRRARPAGDDEDERILFGLMVRESDRLSRLLSEFLDFARVRKQEAQPIDLAAFAEGVVALIRAHPDRPAGVEVGAVVAPTLPPLAGDEDLLHRAAFNLLLNAAQALAPRGAGRVRLEIGPADRELSLLLRPEGDEAAALMLRVSDDGPGIAPQVRERLFDPFVTTKAGGSGLGLALVHRAVEAHGGVVLVDSDARGTRFTILLPATGDGAAVPVAPPVEPTLAHAA
jgi:two-component system sensor histidine kinase PilS (NtrC family)